MTDKATRQSDKVELRDYVDAKIDLTVKIFDAHVAAVCRDMEKTDENMRARLDGLNHLRQAMEDREKDYLTRAEYVIAHQSIVEKLDDVRDFMNTMKGKASQDAMVITLSISILGFLAAILSLFIKH